MKIVAIVLWAVQGFALLGCFVDPNNLCDNFAQWIGFFMPAIIGTILWIKDSRKARKKEE